MPRANDNVSMGFVWKYYFLQLLLEGYHRDSSRLITNSAPGQLLSEVYIRLQESLLRSRGKPSVANPEQSAHNVLLHAQGCS